MNIPTRAALFILGICLILCPLLPGQTDEEETFIESQEENDASGWLELFENLRNNPIDLNQASFNVLQTLPLISPVFAKRIVEERKNHGPFYSWTDFIQRMGVNPTHALAWRPYFYLSQSRTKMNSRIEIRLRALRTFPESEGYGSGAYPGNPLHTTARIKVGRGDRISAGLLVEKDPGETQWNDHAVGFVEIRDPNQSFRMLLGHFWVEAGQGLVLWGPYGQYKGSDPLAPVQKRPLQAKGYLYAAEQKAFRGVLIQKQWHGMQWTGFGSKAGLDGTVNTDGSIGSISTSGLHRTQSERNKHNSFSEMLFGCRLEGFLPLGSVGLAGFVSRYSKPIAHEDMERYRFDFAGRQNHVFGLDWNLFWKNHNASGEAALSRSKGKAIVSTLLTEWDRMDVVVSYRHFDSDFQNPLAADESRNETGWYTGLSVKPSKHSKLGMYFDLFQKPWRTYFIPMPTRGEDLFLQYDQTLPRLFSFSIKARFRLGEKMDEGRTADGISTDILRERFERLVRMEIRHALFHRLELKTYFGYVTVFYPESPDPVRIPGKIENGYLAFQNIRFRYSRQLRLSARWTIFDSDSYDSRLYAFEDDLRGVFSVPACFEKGVKWYVLIQWSPFKNLELSAKYSRIIHPGASSWGSGSDTVLGNTENKLGIQADWTF